MLEQHKKLRSMLTNSVKTELKLDKRIMNNNGT